MTGPVNTSIALLETSTQARASPVGSPLRCSSPATSGSLPGSASIAATSLPSDRQIEDQPLISSPPCIQLLVESAEYLAAAALENWEILCAEIESHRAVFKLCSTARGVFDDTLFQSYCNRVRLVHNSLRCGMLVALRAQLDQLRVWMQISAVTQTARQSFLPNTNVYAEKFGRLMTTLQELDRKSNAVRCPDAVSLGHDVALMREIHAQQDGTETYFTIFDDVTPNGDSTMFAAVDRTSRAKPPCGDDPPSPTAQHLLRVRTKISRGQDVAAAVGKRWTRTGSFPDRVAPVDADDQHVKHLAHGELVSMIDEEVIARRRA